MSTMGSGAPVPRPPGTAPIPAPGAPSTPPALKRKGPIYHKWNVIPCLLMLCYLGSAAWYFWKRIEVMLTGCTSYQIYFLVLEFIGVSAFLPYAMLLMRGRYPTNSPGLPAAPRGADGKPIEPQQPYKMHVRVMVPCYKEPMEVVTDTINATLSADLPEGVKRTVYLCDDGKSDEKRQWIESLGDCAVYVSGRVRKTGEINGKSANLNNALKNVVYKDYPKDPVTGAIDWRSIPNSELLVVFDADMCADKDFFLKILEVMEDEKTALCLTPQAFHNIDRDADIFNNINSQFWEYWLPGAFGWGYIACTGTNFCLRIRALCHCGWFPEYTITEDYALGMELKSRHYEATYLMQYIARGEAPDEVRNVFRQRSRWTKGHYQVFWSRHNPLLNFDLPLFHRMLYAYATWSPFCTTITVPGFMLAPFISVVWGLHPLVITYDFVLTSTIYFTVQCCIQFYVTKFSDLKLMWFVQQSNVILWFTYTKAFLNATAAALGLKLVMFKATDKVVKAAGAVGGAVGAAAGAVGGAVGGAVAAVTAPKRTNEPRRLADEQMQPSHAAPYDPHPDEYDHLEDAETTAYLNSHGQVVNGGPVKPPRPPRPGAGGLGRTSMNGAGTDGGAPRRVSQTGSVRDSAMHRGAGYPGYDPVRRTSHAGSVYDGQGMDPLGYSRRPSYNGAAGAPNGYMPVRLPQSRNGSMDGSIAGLPNVGSQGRLDVRRMDAPSLPGDETHVLSPVRTGETHTGTNPDVTIVMAAAHTQPTSQDPLTDHLSDEQHHNGEHVPHDTRRSALSHMRDVYASAEGYSSEGSMSPSSHAPSSHVPRGMTMAHGSYPEMHHMGDPGSTPSYRHPESVAPHGTPAYSHMSMGSGYHERPAAPAGLNFDEHADVPYDAPPVRTNRRSLPGFEMPQLPPQPRVSGYGMSNPGYVDGSGFPTIPAVSPYGMVQMVPTGQYMAMMPQMAMHPGFRLSYPGNDGAEEKVKLLPDEPASDGKGPARRAPLGDDDDDRVDDERTNENKASTSKERFMRIVESFTPHSIAEWSKCFDPLALLLMWMFNMTIVGLGLWQLITLFNTPTVAEFKFDSPLKGNPYLLIAILWALTNSVAPFLFCYYFCTNGPSFKTVTKYLPAFNTITMVSGVVILWLMIPTNVELQAAQTMSLNAYVPNQVASDTNTNYQFVTGLDANVVSLTALMLRKPGDPLPTLSSTRQLLQSVDISSDAVNLLGGLLAGYDHTKSVMPTAHTITWLVWGATQFAAGYDAASKNQLISVVKAGADYLMRCNLNIDDPSNPVFVAQLGDPDDYAVLDKVGYDPISSGKIWTSPAQDPQLTGTVPRKAWLLTRESVGADLLAEASAALAAASLFVRDSDPTWARSALAHARYLHNFATLDLVTPKTYCNFMPCWGEVEVTEQVRALPVQEPDGTPVCYWVDWIASVCRIELTQRACDERRRVVNEVFTTKSACCSYLSSLNVWSGTFTRAQGICALPDDQWYCYQPDLNQRTCYKKEISQTTGAGCSGKGMEVFQSSLGCCNWLSNQSPAPGQSQTPMGECARTGTDVDFTVCYIPNLVNGTCDEGTGALCKQYGIVTSYDQPVGCCNALATMLKDTAFVSVEAQTQTTVVRLRGICSPYIGMDPANSAPSGRRLQELPEGTSTDTPVRRAAKKRSLLATDATAAATTPAAPVELKPGDPGYIDNSTLWPLSVEPKFFEDPCNPKVTTTTTMTGGSQQKASCILYPLRRPYNVTYFNSTSVFDDLAWSAIWLHKATGETRFLGQAQHFLDQHYQSEVTTEVLQTSREVYVPDWDNQGWGANVLLAQLTNATAYHERVRNLLQIWVFGDAVPSRPAPGVPEDVVLNGRVYDNFTVPSVYPGGKNQTYAIIPECTPSQIYEEFCYDGKDDDCNGLTDLEDPACGLFPVIYTSQQMAWSSSPSMPDAANAAFLALAYSSVATGNTPSRLRCWALSQIGHMLGSGSDEISYVVGFGKEYPTQVQHRGSSCPKPAITADSGLSGLDIYGNTTTVTDEPTCDWTSGYYPSTPNPQLSLIAGALVSGPDRYDHAEQQRTSNNMRVALHNNAGYLSALAALVATETNIRSCESLNGVWQRYVTATKTV